MKPENGWLQKTYTTHMCDNGGNQISEQKTQIIKEQFASYAVSHADQAREACFFSTVDIAVREDA